jgi:hypothetical protein
MAKKAKRTQETRAVEGLAKLLTLLLTKSINEGMDIYYDRVAAKALKSLRTTLQGWGLD